MSDSYKDIFTARIKMARKLSGYTQADVEEQLNIAKSSISKYEHGTLQPTLNAIGELATLYDCSVDWLFGLGRKGSINFTSQDRETSKAIEKEAKRKIKAEKQMIFYGEINGGKQSIE